MTLISQKQHDKDMQSSTRTVLKCLSLSPSSLFECQGSEPAWESHTCRGYTGRASSTSFSSSWQSSSVNRWTESSTMKINPEWIKISHWIHKYLRLELGGREHKEGVGGQVSLDKSVSDWGETKPCVSRGNLWNNSWPFFFFSQYGWYIFLKRGSSCFFILMM